MHDFTPSDDLVNAVAALHAELSDTARPFLAALLHALGPEDDNGEPKPATRWAGGAFDPARVDEIHGTVVTMYEAAQRPSADGLIEYTRQRARLTAAGLEHEADAAIAAFIVLRPLLTDHATMH